MRRTSAVALVLLAACCALPLASMAQQSCDRLAAFRIPRVTITQATAITPAPEYEVPNPPAPFRPEVAAKVTTPFCRIVGYATPEKDSHINFEVWLPRAERWNGKYLGIGSPGFVGYIAYGALARNIQKGYATAATDSGHTDVDTPGEAPTADWAGNPDKVADWGHRGQHETTVIAKQLAKAFYGTPIRYAYWNSCHEGGNQALTELQRYPDDFDGIVAGGPAYYITRLQASTLYTSMALVGDGPDSPTFFPTAKYPMLHRAVLDACDTLDGVRDNIIDDPTACHFDPKTIQCPAYKDEPSCLTAVQVDAVRRVYDGSRFADGSEIYPGYERGSELNWGVLGRGPGPIRVSKGFFETMVYPDRNWDYRTFDIDRDTRHAERKLGASVDSKDPNLSAFRDRGGKVIMYQAWEEGAIPPRGLVNYYRAVTDTMGGLEKTQRFARLFMVAGLGMCPGFSDPGGFDTQAAIERWVEQKEAPDTILAMNRVEGKAVRSRPICAWPKAAIHDGKGDPNSAESYRCGARN